MISIIDTLQPLGNFFAVLAEDVGVGEVSLEAVLHASELELTKKASKEYVDEQITTIPKITKTSQLQNDSGFLTQHQDLSAYVKKSEIPAVPTKLSQLQNDAGYAKTSDIPAVPTKTSQLQNDSGFLNEHQDISGKANNDYVASVSARVDELKTEQRNLSARMDTFTSLQEGSTTGDAELIDARVGYDGKTYTNLKERLDATDNNLETSKANIGVMEILAVSTNSSGIYYHYDHPVKKGDVIFIKPISSTRSGASGLIVYGTYDGEENDVLARNIGFGEFAKIVADKDYDYIRLSSYPYVSGTHNIVCQLLITSNTNTIFGEVYDNCENIAEINHKIGYNFNPIDLKTIIVGFYPKTTTGELVEYGSYFATDFYPTFNVGSFEFNGTNQPEGKINMCCFYDESKKYITGLAVSNNTPVKVPDDAYYVRFGFNYGDRSSIKFFNVYPIDMREKIKENIEINHKIGYYFNPIDAKNITSGYYPRTSDGTLVENGDYFTTNYYPTYAVGTFTLDGTNQPTGRVNTCCFYNSEKVFIYGQTVTNNTPVKVPALASYVRLGFNKNDINTITFFDAAPSKDSFESSSHWFNKKWYAYGTSITSISLGKYVPFVTMFSGMNTVNKGISGGGLGDFGAHSKGEVYEAICNITDGKLDADLITLETGANDTNSGVPLGTIYDTGRSTLAGCLNDCLRYLQTNTNAQIVVFPSPIVTTAPNAEDKRYEWARMVREICDINRVHYIDSNNNLGYAKVTAEPGKYLVDNIHQTQLGGYVFAENVWAQLKNIPMMYSELPN